MLRLTKIVVGPAVFVVGFFLYVMEIASDWIIGVQSKTEYVRTGACKQCGRCCQLLALEMPLYISKREYLVRFLNWFHQIFFNFQFEGVSGRLLVYRCGYYMQGNLSGCRIYPFRHRLCRFYPRQRLYGHPETHPECGYKFVKRNGRKIFNQVLENKFFEDRTSTNL